MKSLKSYVALKIRVFRIKVHDVVRTSQVDVYSNDSYGDNWTDGALKK
ncbi:MAG: hypothetical protein IKA88_05490 [Clostridia bacterium]|nr:hypothetical protein [Clostridia bacterium]